MLPRKQAQRNQMEKTGFCHSPQCDIKLHCSKFELVNRDKHTDKDFLNTSEKLNLESTLCTVIIAEATHSLTQ